MLQVLYKNPSVSFDHLVEFVQASVVNNHFAVLDFLVHTYLPEMSHSFIAELLNTAIQHKNENTTILLLRTYFSDAPANCMAEVFEQACSKKLLAVVKEILPSPSIKEIKSELLLNALRDDAIDMATLFIYDSRVILTEGILFECCQKGLVEFTQIILNNPSVDNNTAFINACCHKESVIQHLLKYCSDVNPNITINNTFPLLLSAAMKNFDVFKALLGDPRVDPTLQNNRVLFYIAKRASTYPRQYIQLLLEDKRVLKLLHSKEAENIFVKCVKKRSKSLAIFLLEHIVIHWKNHDALQFICKEYPDEDILCTILKTSINVNVLKGILVRTIGQHENVSLLQLLGSKPDLKLREALLYRDSYKNMTLTSLVFFGQHLRTSLSTMHLIRCHIVKQCIHSNCISNN